MTYHRDDAHVSDNSSENGQQGPASDIVNCAFSIIAVVVLLGDVHSAADKVMSHSGSHGCESASLRVCDGLSFDVSIIEVE